MVSFILIFSYVFYFFRPHSKLQEVRIEIGVKKPFFTIPARRRSRSSSQMQIYDSKTALNHWTNHGFYVCVPSLPWVRFRVWVKVKLKGAVGE